MAGTLRENRNELFRAITDAWIAAPEALGIAEFYPLLYGTIDSDGVPNSDPDNKPWARANIQHDDGRSTTISERRFEVTGIITVQVFQSSYYSSAKTVTQRVAEYLAHALMDHEGNVIVNNPRVVDRLGDSGFERTDVQADFKWYGFRSRVTTEPKPEIPGGPTMEFIQATPALVWIVNHNLGYKPTVETLSQDGSEMLAEVRHESNNQFRVTFDEPTAGSALYR